MKNMIMQFVEQMTHEEKLDLQMALESAIAEEMVPAPAGEAGACPRCGCPKFVKKGRGRRGEQRWLCLGCGRTFGPATRGLLVHRLLDEPGGGFLAVLRAEPGEPDPVIRDLDVQAFRADGFLQERCLAGDDLFKVPQCFIREAVFRDFDGESRFFISRLPFCFFFSFFFPVLVNAGLCSTLKNNWYTSALISFRVFA